MRHPISDADRRKVETALRKLGEVIKSEYTPILLGSIISDDAEPEDVFRWGLGDGFAMALQAVVDAALPGWKDRR